MDLTKSKTGDSEVERLAQEIESRLLELPTQGTEAVRAVRRALSKRLRQAPGRFVLAVAFSLLRRPPAMLRFLAYELLSVHDDARASLSARDLEKLGQGMGDWSTVDAFACYLAGPAWREHQVDTALIRRWSRSPDRFWRRAAVVSTVALNNRARGGQGDAIRTLAICRLLVTDRDALVEKALSWALRELAKRSPAQVRDFLATNDAMLAARVKREVQSKLETGRKNPRRRLRKSASGATVQAGMS